MFKPCNRLALAKVGKGPDGVACKTCVGRCSVDQLTDLWEDVLVEKCVSEPNVVSCDVTQTPDRLLLNLDVSR